MILRLLGVCALASLIAGCGEYYAYGHRPVAGALTRTAPALADLPAAARPLNVAVYDFPDLTGAHKPNERYAEYSKAITQGAAAIVVDALKTAGGGRRFRVVERTRLDNLLRERKLIQDTYTGLGHDWKAAIQPLEFAEYIVEGAIVSYDASFVAGGIAAAYLGIGGDVNYRKDLITLNLRLVSVRDGAVLKSITVARTVFSITPSANVTRFVTAANLLVVKAGVTAGEATQVAVREAVEAAVHELVVEGDRIGLWATKPPRLLPEAVGGSRQLEGGPLPQDRIPKGSAFEDLPAPERLRLRRI